MKNTTQKIKPLQDRVLIKADESSKEKKTSSGIIIPVTVDDDKNGKRGLVIAIGPGRMEDGELIKPAVKEGDKLLFLWGDKIVMDNEDYYIVRESEILAIIN
jgi:chaperonin GroES